MRNCYLGSTALVLALSATAGSATELVATSRIAAVTVFSDGATVTRSAPVELPTGSSTIRFEGLPSALDPSSIRIEGLGEGEIVIGSVETHAMPADIDAANAVNAKLDGLMTQRKAIQAKIDGLQLQRSSIERYAQSGPEAFAEKGKPIDVTEWSKAWTAVGEAAQSVNGALNLAESDAKRLDDAIAALRQTLPEARRVNSPVYEVSVVVEAARATKARFDLSYQVRGARWTPVYDARLVTSGVDKPKMEFKRRATVNQNTGEDWADVALQLSTVRVNRRASAPVVMTSTLNLRDLAASALLKGESPAVPAPSADAVKNDFVARGRYQKLRPDETVAAVPVSENALDAETGAYQAAFKVPGIVSIPAGNAERSFVLSSRSFDPELSVKVAPSIEAAAYLEARLENLDDSPLLPGKVMIHRDGAYIGQGALKLTQKGDSTTLGFGVDDAVKVTRNPVARRENDGGFFGGGRYDLQDYKTSIKNLHGFPVHLVVVDGLPVSENAAIIVETLPTNTPATEKNVEDKRGVVSWSYDLKPTETKEIRFGRRVKWPADRELLFNIDVRQQFRFRGGNTF